MPGTTSATLMDQYTLSGRGRAQQTQVTVPGGKLIIEQENEQPAWLIPVVKVIGELLNLPENWDSYGARPINPTATAFALQLLSETMRTDTPVPAVVPTSSGGVQLEWHARGIDLEVEIRSPSRLYVSYEDHRHSVEWEGELTSDLTRLGDFLSEFSQRS
jgi:hypothetical protein